MMAIDGTWQRECLVNDVAETEATITMSSSIQGLALKEFFLLLSSVGVAYRRCSLAWVNGDQIGVSFVRPGNKSGKPRKKPDELTS
ncbi:PilZ domain-containing protein [Bradyrhizobium jicamae]|uniref:PilZ domain-containing protein n=1 Tax=Bradyrhizobium jicamae TaxID=280332 RepID=UPI003D9B094B